MSRAARPLLKQDRTKQTGIGVTVHFSSVGATIFRIDFAMRIPLIRQSTVRTFAKYEQSALARRGIAWSNLVKLCGSHRSLAFRSRHKTAAPDSGLRADWSFGPLDDVALVLSSFH
jgi:hypothetical protein